jgi:hypothetical protein
MTVAHTTRPPAPATLEITHCNQPSNRDLQSDANTDIVLHNALDAKEKMVNAKATEEVVAAIMALGPKKPALMLALVDCICSDHTAKAIADRHSIHQSVLSYWSQRLGLPKRRRGRRVLLRPTLEHQRILKLVGEHGIAKTARRVGVSKQRIFQIVCRWAPQLSRRPTFVKAVTLPPRQRRPPRKIVVSFRISTDEWQRLLAATPISGESGMSGCHKARAIVLHHIGPTGRNGQELAQASASPAPEMKNP